MEGNDVVDILYEGETQQITTFKHPFIYTNNAHGTGCTLSSAIASFLAKGYSMKEAVERGGHYIIKTLEKSRMIQIGKGRQGIMNHMWENFQYE